MTTGNYSDLSSLNERYEVFQKLNNISKKYGNKELYVYGIDEADVKHFEGQYPVWEKIHRLGGKIFPAEKS